MGQPICVWFRDCRWIWIMEGYGRIYNRSGGPFYTNIVSSVIIKIVTLVAYKTCLFSKWYIIGVGFITFYVVLKGVQVFIAFKICIHGIPYDWSSIPYRCSPYFSLISWNFKLHRIAQSSGFLLDYSTQGLRAVFIIHLCIHVKTLLLYV